MRGVWFGTQHDCNVLFLTTELANCIDGAKVYMDGSEDKYMDRA